VQSTPARERSAAPELTRAYAELTSRFSDEAFSRSIIASGRTRKLQVGLLAAIVTIALAPIALHLIRTEAPRVSAAPVGLVVGTSR
jgi:hypothetical protein